MCTTQKPPPHPGWSMHGKCHTPPAPCCRPTRSRSPHIHAAASGHNTTKSLHQSSCPRLVAKHMLFSPMDAVNALGSFSFRLRTRANKYNLYLSLKPCKFCASVFVRPSYNAECSWSRLHECSWLGTSMQRAWCEGILSGSSHSTSNQRWSTHVRTT